MAVIATYSQQPADRLDYDVYYADAPDGAESWLATGDRIASAQVVVSPAGLTVSELVSAKYIKLWVEGGASGTTYKVTITVTTTVGRKKQDEIKFRVKDI